MFWAIILKETARIYWKYFHKKGLMSKALQAVLHFGFHSLHLKTIEAFTYKNNTVSKALLEKHLFVFQPKRRDDSFENNRIFRLVNNSL